MSSSYLYLQTPLIYAQLLQITKRGAHRRRQEVRTLYHQPRDLRLQTATDVQPPLRSSTRTPSSRSTSPNRAQRARRRCPSDVTIPILSSAVSGSSRAAIQVTSGGSAARRSDQV